MEELETARRIGFQEKKKENYRVNKGKKKPDQLIKSAILVGGSVQQQRMAQGGGKYIS